MSRSIAPLLARGIGLSASHRTDEIARTVWDVCVVGSGPGGAVAAATLAEAGWRVLLIERGAYRPADQLNFRFLDMPMRLGRLDVTKGARVALHQGNVLGGGSVIWGAVAMMPPKFIFDEWARVSEVNSITADSLAPHYAYVADKTSVTLQKAEQENRSNAIVRQMAAALDHPEGLELVRRYTRGCRGTGLCNIGCGFDLKGTMTNSFLPMALETGNLTVRTECEAIAFDGEQTGSGFRATALHVVVRDVATGKRISRFAIKAKSFVVASGAIHSSALLLRTGALARRSNAQKVWLQPHAAIHALFDEPVTKGATGQIGRHLPFNGVPAIYNFTGMLRDRGYCWFASVLHPASLATCAAQLSPDEHVALMSRFHYTSSLTITMRDNPDRSRILMRGGRPQLDYLESASDCERLRRCFIDASRALLAVGARRVFLPMLQPPRIESESDLNAIERIEMSYDRVLLYSDHMSGGNAFGGDARLGVTDENGRVFGSENVYIADSSLFPSPSGVGPSWTIMALSRLVASRLAAARSGSCRARNSDGHSSVSPSRGDRRTVTIGQVCSALIRHPLRSVVYRWHWKNAIASALLRSTLFFLTNLAAGHDAAIRATLVEFALRIPLVGVLAAVTQSFSYVYPVWAATFFAVAGLPTLALVTECVVHWLVRTPELATSMQASIALSAFSTMFGLFVMRRGVMIVDDVHRPFGDDLKQLPRLVVEFALALPRRLAQAGR